MVPDFGMKAGRDHLQNKFTSSISLITKYDSRVIVAGDYYQKDYIKQWTKKSDKF